MASNAYRHGDWATICDRCGFRFYASQLRREWTGLRVCSGGGTNNCYEPRHPQDFVRGRADKQAPPWVRPEPPDIIRSQYTNAELIEGDVLATAGAEEVLALEGDAVPANTPDFLVAPVNLEGDAV